MPDDRVSSLLDAYFTQPYVDYGDVVLEIRSSGGLTSQEVGLIKNRVLCIDANAIIRHAGISETQS